MICIYLSILYLQIHIVYKKLDLQIRVCHILLCLKEELINQFQNKMKFWENYRCMKKNMVIIKQYIWIKIISKILVII
jgi:hypothetical protein